MRGTIRPVGTASAHPAETGAGLAAAVAVVIAHFANVSDPATTAALVIVVGAVPVAITFVVNLLRRRAGDAPAP